MISISVDEEKQHILLDLTNHGLFPYGTQTLTFAINSLGLEAETELLKIYSNADGVEQAFCYVNELFIGGVKANMNNVTRLFNDLCYNGCDGGGGGGGDIHIDTNDIVKAIDSLNKTMKCNCGGHCCEYEETYLTLEQYNSISAQSPNMKYIIYCSSGDCTYDESDFIISLDPDEEVCEENLDFNEKYMTTEEYDESDKDADTRYNIYET